MTSLLPLLKETTIPTYDTSHVNLKFSDAMLSNGVLGKQTSVQSKTGHGVVLIAKKVVRGIAYYAMQSEHHPMTNKYSLEFPLTSSITTDNFVPASEKLKTVASMTYVDAEPLKVGTVSPDTGVASTTVGVWLVRTEDNRNVFAPHADDDSIRWMTSGEVQGAIMTGRITDGVTLSAWAVLQAHHAFSFGEEHR